MLYAVPPSAWSTSQSTVTCSSPNATMSHTERRERPISRWISWVRPDCLPLAASRVTRSPVDPGRREYSAVTQPLPLPRIHGGTRSSTEAVQRTLVWPIDTSTDPGAKTVKSRSKEADLISSVLRPSARLVSRSTRGVPFTVRIPFQFRPAPPAPEMPAPPPRPAGRGRWSAIDG